MRDEPVGGLSLWLVRPLTSSYPPWLFPWLQGQGPPSCWALIQDRPAPQQGRNYCRLESVTTTFTTTTTMADCSSPMTGVSSEQCRGGQWGWLWWRGSKRTGKMKIWGNFKNPPQKLKSNMWQAWLLNRLWNWKLRWCYWVHILYLWGCPAEPKGSLLTLAQPGYSLEINTTRPPQWWHRHLRDKGPLENAYMAWSS